MLNVKSSSDIWNQLTEEEKLLMNLYKFKLENGIPLGGMRNLILEATKIYEKYPDFDMSVVP